MAGLQEPILSELEDSFQDEQPDGMTIGTLAASGIERLGADNEARVSVDNGALRFHPLNQPGWGRQGIAYGPFVRQPGLTLAVFMLNGHNTSQTFEAAATLQDHLRLKVRGGLWMAGQLMRISKPEEKPKHPISSLKAHYTSPPLKENLVVGWFNMPTVVKPLEEGQSFVMHAAGPDNGELWVRTGVGVRPLCRGVQNNPIYYVVALRERGAAFYAASLPGAKSLGSLPKLRPVAIDPRYAESQLYAGIHQAILGEVGYRADTRVYGVRVKPIAEWSQWYTTAFVADRNPQVGRKAEMGEAWGLEGVYSLQKPEQRPGLIHLRLEGKGAVVWRYRDKDSFLELELLERAARIRYWQGEEWIQLALDRRIQIGEGQHHWIQILDDGKEFAVHVDGQLVGQRAFADIAVLDAAGFGFRGRVADVEAHPREVELPQPLSMGQPWQAEGTTLEVSDDFAGMGKLAGLWEGSLGGGMLERTGKNSLRVQASPKQPNPGRTLFTQPWNHPALADLEVEITPPGSRRGQKHNCRSGLVFWQDTKNYLIVNLWLDDAFSGSSVSAFLRYENYEGFYDAVWSNVGQKIRHGVSVKLRVICDGSRFRVYLDGEPVLYRAFSDIYPGASGFLIKRVGLAVNWEWGDDTGSVFRRFRARF
jgi:hypothetical protein